jgi:WD40 repeat protein
VTTTFRRATLAPDGRRVVTTNWEADDRVFVWDVATRRHPPGFPPDGIPGRAARVVTPERVLVVGPDGTRQLYDLASGRAVGPPLWTGEPDSGGFVRAAGNGREFIIQQAGTLRTVTAAGEVVATATAREQLFQPFALSPDGGTAAFNHPDGVALVDARTGEVRHRLRGHTATVWAAAFSPDGRRLFTAAADQTVRVWDVAAGQGVLALRHENGLVALALSADGHRLATQEQWNARGTVFDATPVP